MNERRVVAIAARQHGLLTRQQALAAGMTADQVDHRVRTGRWVPVRRGVYLIAGVPPSKEQAVLAAVLAAGDGVLASHGTAAEVWGLGMVPPHRIHVLTPDDRRLALDGVRQHRSDTIHADDRTVHRGIPVTSPARTIVDCSGAVGVARLEEIVDDARRRQLVRPVDLARCIDRLATGPGRRPTVGIRAVTSERLPIGDSAREKRLVRDLLRAGLPMPVLGHPVQIRGRSFRIDVCWPWARVGLEYDSWAFHSSFRSFHRDRERLRLLLADDWDIWPVTSRTDVAELAVDLLPRLSGGFTAHRAVNPPETA